MDLNKIINSDCIEGMGNMPDQFVDLVLTSPPYAMQRNKHYNSITEEEYPSWTVKWMDQCKRILKPTGSVAVVIRTNIRNGCISPYVINTRLALWNDGWIEPEELVWIKPDAPPLGSCKRPRRSWENILWFARSGKEVYCNPRGNGRPSDRIGLETNKGVGDYKRGISKARSGIARGRDYFEVGTSKVDKSPQNTHPAQYPALLAEQIISVLCPVGGLVLDPFMGSGSTAVACIKTKRNYIGFDTNAEYCSIAEARIAGL
jgi:DNA modification methylase